MQWSDRFPYNEATVRRVVPKAAGVYRLIYVQKSQQQSKYYVFYVGQSLDLEERLLAHLRASEPNPCIKRKLANSECFFRYTQIASAAERERVEEEQIAEFNPDCNRTSR